MDVDLDALRTESQAALASCQTRDQVEQFRVEWLGRKSALAQILGSIGALPPDQRKTVGQQANRLKVDLEQEIATKLAELERVELAAELAASGFDPTLPGTAAPPGSLHPVTLVQYELEDIFTSLGFMVLDGPDCDTDYYNFESLNIPAHHPARDAQDTFYCTNGMVLRTHTSNCQVRAMRTYSPPFRAIFPGRCYRNEAVDAKHDMMFHQVEGLMIDRDISVANMIAVLQIALSQIFHQDVKIRLRPGYFPFVEPGLELDMEWERDGGVEWLEMVGCGLVHPNVLRAGGIDPEQWSGFAFGMGLTRLAMLKYKIADIRLLSGGDCRFLSQFPAE